MAVSRPGWFVCAEQFGRAGSRRGEVVVEVGCGRLGKSGNCPVATALGVDGAGAEAAMPLDGAEDFAVAFPCAASSRGAVTGVGARSPRAVVR